MDTADLSKSELKFYRKIQKYLNADVILIEQIILHGIINIGIPKDC